VSNDHEPNHNGEGTGLGPDFVDGLAPVVAGRWAMMPAPKGRGCWWV